VDRQEEQIAHESNVITPANLCKTAPQGPFGLEFRNSPPTSRISGQYATSTAGRGKLIGGTHEHQP
jgi:hypothetical protein